MNTIKLLYTRVERFVKKTSLWVIFMIILAVLLIITSCINSVKITREGFTQQTEKYVLKKNNDIYDQFYVNVYDDLFYKELTNNYEVGTIENITEPTNESIILDIGSKTGHICGLLKEQNYNVTGLDESHDMVQFSKKEYPDIKFTKGSPLKSITYNNDSFTHILCLNQTIYHYKNKKDFIQNVYNWLKPGGYFAIQLIDKNDFDPVIPSAKPFFMINPQSFAKNKITTSNVVFNNFRYTGDFKTFPNDVVQYREIFKDTTAGNEKVRENILEMWMPPKSTIVNIAKETGFIVFAEVDLMMAQLEYQYLYIFQKPA